VAIQILDGLRRIASRHFHETEAARSTRLAIHDQRHALYRAVLREQRANGVFGGRERQVADVDFAHSMFSLYERAATEAFGTRHARANCDSERRAACAGSETIRFTFGRRLCAASGGSREKIASRDHSITFLPWSVAFLIRALPYTRRPERSQGRPPFIPAGSTLGTLHQNDSRHRRKVAMLLLWLTVLFALTAGLLWWKLSRANDENALLHAEILRLRKRASRLRA
jgi:hypothetical protein